MCDADETYDASAAPALVEELTHNGLDMVVGTRIDPAGTAYRPAHKFGNWMLTSLVRVMFGNGFSDMLSEWERQLAGAAAEIEKSAGPVEAELGDDTVEERLRIAGPVLRIMPGGSSEQTAAGSAW